MPLLQGWSWGAAMVGTWLSHGETLSWNKPPRPSLKATLCDARHWIRMAQHLGSSSCSSGREVPRSFQVSKQSEAMGARARAGPYALNLETLSHVDGASSSLSIETKQASLSLASLYSIHQTSRSRFLRPPASTRPYPVHRLGADDRLSLRATRHTQCLGRLWPRPALTPSGAYLSMQTWNFLEIFFSIVSILF
jgi:hypothetical protein